MIFYVVAATDLLLPIIISTTWLYLTLSLSGFPFRSSSTKFRLKRVGRLAMIWSLGRILYSVMTLLTFTRVRFAWTLIIIKLKSLFTPGMVWCESWQRNGATRAELNPYNIFIVFSSWIGTINGPGSCILRGRDLAYLLDTGCKTFDHAISRGLSATIWEFCHPLLSP